MSRPPNRRTHYTSAEVARILEVDPKTVHNWVDSGHISEAFRTPGNHLRVKHEVLLGFLKTHGYPVPEGFEGELNA